MRSILALILLLAATAAHAQVLGPAPCGPVTCYDATLYGGKAVGSTLTLQGTSNAAPVADNVYLRTGGVNTLAACASSGVTGVSIAANGANLGCTGAVALTLLNNTGNGQFVVKYDNGGLGILFNQPTSGGDASINQQANAQLLFHTNNNFHTAFTADGAIQIGVNGGASPGAGGLLVNGQTYLPNITQTSVAQTGTVCWISTGSPAGKITVDTTVGCLASSERVKNVLGPLDSAEALDIVSHLKPIRFTRKLEYGGNLDPAEQFGLTAEQAAQVDERLIARGEDGLPKGVRYMEFTAVLAAAIQELRAEIRSLKHAKH